MKTRIIISICIFIIAIISAVLLYLYNPENGLVYHNQGTWLQKQRDIDKLYEIMDKAQAQGIVVYDLNANKVIAGKNLQKTFTLASLTKIFTATFVYERDKSKLNDIRNMLKVSDNNEAERLALAFAPDIPSQGAYMTMRTKDLGLHFTTPSGLDTDDGRSGGEGKPLDILSFIKDSYVKYPEMFDQTIKPDGNTNIIVNDLPFLAGGKTGFTQLAGGNLFVTIQKGLGRDIFILVLNSTPENRFVDVQNIANFLIQSSI